MALSNVKPDQTKAHSFLVTNIEDKNKVFPSKEGQKSKFVIEFANGYAAEYCPFTKDGLHPSLQIGKEFSFKIIFRKDFGDEIAYYKIADGENLNQGTSYKTVSMGGHPAVIALMASKDLVAAKIKAGIPVELQNEFDPVTETLENADLILSWLTKQAND